MIKLELIQIAIELNAKLIGDSTTISNVSTDTRTLESGDLFIALSGENFDGNTFAKSAVEKGAAAIIVTKKQAVNVPQLIVKDTRIALGLLGKMVREIVAPKVAALTGSNGKTTTKEMLASILSLSAKTLSTAGNFNNDIGAPLTLLRLEPSDAFAVIELGANHKKEIAYTTSLALPDVVLINNVGAAHIEGFGDLQGVAQAKGEILQGIKNGGKAVLNRDDKFYSYWLRKISPEQHVSFSLKDESAEFYAKSISFDAMGLGHFTLCSPAGEVAIALPVAGQHNIANALAAAAMAASFDMSLALIKQGLETMSNVKGRLKISALNSRIRIIDDSYNANIASVKAAIDVLTHFESENVLIFGDMGELGKNTAEFHQQVGYYANEKQVDHVYTCGVHSREAALTAGASGRAFLDQEVLVDALFELMTKLKPAQEFTILFKGSRSAKMEHAITLLANKFTESPEKEERC